MAENKKIAVILVRSLQGAKKGIIDTLKMLNIRRRNVCVVLDKKPNMVGMVNKVRSYVTYGDIDEETLGLLKQKKDKKYYNLNSPRKGYGRKGIKYDYSRGGALGDRGNAINDLIKRMV